jgi:hypothetical protein
MLEFLSTTDQIKLLQVDGWLPTFHLLFQMPGIIGVDSDEEPIMGNAHEVELRIHSDYPMALPRMIFRTPLFHPNVFESGDVCMGWFRLPYFLPDVCIRLAEMIDYQSLSTMMPSNCTAAIWAERHGSRFPLGNWLIPSEWRNRNTAALSNR